MSVNPEYIKAMIAAKKAFKPLTKNKVNPYFKSKYADLPAVHEAVDDALAANGFLISHPMGFDEKGNLILSTKITHTSGGADESRYPLPQAVKPQELAAAVTYARRVSLSALLGIPADDDDDGNAANATHKPEPAKKPNEIPKDPTMKKAPVKEAAPAHTGSWALPAGLEVGKAAMLEHACALCGGSEFVVRQSKSQKNPGRFYLNCAVQKCGKTMPDGKFMNTMCGWVDEVVKPAEVDPNEELQREAQNA